MMKRPKPGENEEDLLRMQEEYLSKKSKDSNMKPAAAVTNLRFAQKRSHCGDKDSVKVSKFAQSRGLTNRQSSPGTSKSLLGDIVEKNSENHKLDVLSDNIYSPKSLPCVLGDILEKNYDTALNFDTPFPSSGFPEVTIFSEILQKEQVKEKVTSMDVDEISFNSAHPTTSRISDKSYMVTSIEANEIHTENISKLNQLEETEIIQEKEKLLSSLDPKIIDFIKSKRKANQAPKTEMDVDVSPVVNKKKSVTFKEDEIKPDISNYDLWDNDIVSHPNATKWLHFDSLEKDKLEWMKGITESKNITPDEPYEARFNFQGYLLPYSIEYTEETKTLFHHGEEPHRPGYSLSELFELSRSTVIQQRVMALNTMAGVLEFASTGIYKDIIELPYSKIFFVIRIALDDNKVIILESALKAMRNLLYNRIDEASLDAMLGFAEGTQEPCLENDKSEIEELDSKESDLKDFHLAEIDLVAAALRTDIIQRIYYILDAIRPSFNSVQYSLQILIRLARDSVDTATKIVESKHLMNSIIKNFVPSTSINFMFDPNTIYKNKPVLAALKLIRILTLQSVPIRQIFIKDFDMLSTLSVYISSGIESTYGLKIQTEALFIFCNIISFDNDNIENNVIESAKSLLPVILTSLDKHIMATDISLDASVISVTHAAALVQCVNKLLSFDNSDGIKTLLCPLLKSGLVKWVTQVSVLDNFTCGHLRVVCSVLDVFKTILSRTSDSNEKLFMCEQLKKLSRSSGYTLIVKQLVTSSNLLSNIRNQNMYFIKNLVSLGTAVVNSNQRLLPILTLNSPFQFLNALFKVLYFVNDTKLVSELLEPLAHYLTKISKSELKLTDNWFTRIETDLIFNVLKVLKYNMAENHKDAIYAVANKLSYILRCDKREELQFLFNEIIFNKSWFPTEILLGAVFVSEANSSNKVLNSIEDIKLCYNTIIGVNDSNTATDNFSLVSVKWKDPLLPRDWVYLPILNLYSKNQEADEFKNKDNQEVSKTKELTILRCLEWILFNETCFPDILNEINITDRFCRIMCVFLTDNSLFLEPNIKNILNKLLRMIFDTQKHTPFDFDKDLVGLNNFQDFYTQFLEQFQSVSYGDVNFGACVLVPLAQKHNVKWRKLLWSEYAGCLRALDCPEDMFCYDLNEYLYPVETEESLIKSYFRALSCNLVRENTVAHKIALHHTQMYKKRNEIT